MAIDKNAIAKEAQKFVTKGQFDKAIAEWRKLLKETPDDPNVYNTIGDLCLKKDAKADAVDAYKTAADLLAGDGFTSKAIALYKKVLNIDSSRIDVHLALGDMNAEKGLTGNALENYKHVADHYLKNNKKAEALGIYQKMADMNPSNAAFRIKLADMYAKESMKPEAAKAYLAAADIHVSKDAFQDARQLFEKVLSLDPNNKEVYHKAGIVYFKEGKFAEACKALKPAFENDPSNQELVATYLDALSKAGKDTEAEEVFKKLLKLDPDKIELREKLYNLYLSEKEYEKALAEASMLADAQVHSGTPAAAEKILKAIVNASPQFVPARRKLAEFYAALDQFEDASLEFLRAADILIEDGHKDDEAKEVLARILEFMPTMPEARQRLERLSPSAAPPPPPGPEFTAPEPEPIIERRPDAVPETAASIVEITPPPVIAATPVAEDDPAINEAFTEADVLIKYGLMPKAMEQLESLVSKFPENPRIRIRLRDLYHEQGDNDKAVRHALLAVALYTKYGKEDLAGAVMQSTQEMAPDHPAVIARLGRAAASALAASVTREEPEFEASDFGSPPPQAVAPAELHPPKIMPDHLELETTLPEIAPTAFDEIPSAFGSAPTGEIVFEGLDSSIQPLEAAAPAAPPPVQEIPAAEEPLIEEAPALEMEQPVAELPREPFAAAPQAPTLETQQPAAVIPEEPFAAVPQAPPEEMDVSEIWAEAEFYFQQGLFDEAKKLYARIIGIAPSDNRAIERLAEISREQVETQEFAKLAEAVDDLENALIPHAPSPADEMALSSSDEEAVRSLMQEIQQLREQEAPAPQAEEIIAEAAPRISREPAAPSRPEPPRAPAEAVRPPRAPEKPAPKAVEEDYFDLGEELQAESKTPAAAQKASSDDFFDLAAELRDELSTAPMSARPALPAEEQSLEDIFEEFKKGVEQQAVKEDADTHYNLGVAYKEMGLLDDAIAEFIMTPEDESKFIQSRYMLGLCYMEKGEYRNAIGEIQNALDYSESMGEESDEDLIGMHYDLGLAYQGAGSTDKALEEFLIVSRTNPRYRDVAVKIKELKKGGHISLDQIKGDIEKEISSKFLQEGARIEREEKTKRSEKIKS